MKRRVKALTVVLAICLITVFIRCQSNETPIQQLVVVVNGDSIEMVFVKGGTFMMDVQMSRDVTVRITRNQHVRSRYLIFT